MDHFDYRKGELFAEDVPLARIAEAVGTPFYCYATATLLRHYSVLADALRPLDGTIFYAVKANSNQAVIGTFARAGAGADVVSEGELRRALAAGVPANMIVFSGVGKTASEMAFALDAGILQFNVESRPELELLSQVANGRGRTAAVSVRINPDVAAGTHAKITTGTKENKFGIAWPEVRAVCARAAQLPGIDLVGVALHIGSQLLALAPFEAAFARAREMVTLLRGDGHRIRRLDLGGGLGIPYRGEAAPSPADYAAMVQRAVGDLDCKLMFEPGRMLVGNAGVLVSRVIYAKESGGRRFVIVDAAMNDLIRPALYEAWHDIVPVREPAPDAPRSPADVVGPICETGDTFAKDRELPPFHTNDLLAFRTAGAYGSVMASTYNSRLLVPEILVNGPEFAVVRPRPSYDALLAADALPPWL